MALYQDNCWARLESVISWSKMSTNRFALSIGLKRAETLYHIERGDHGISRKLTEMIVTKFPEINPSWLLTGAGEMFSSMMESGEKIDFFNLDCEREIRSIEGKNPDSKITFPDSVKADLAMRYNSAAMNNTIPSNSVVVLKRVEVEQIIYGDEYLILTPNITSLRIVRTTDKDDTLRLVATNSELYDDLQIKRKEIEAIYRVTAKLIVN